MIVPGSANALMLGQSQGYNLTKSLRFRSSASAYLSRTNTTPTNANKWTWSGWVKRGALGTQSALFGAWKTVNGVVQCYFQSNDTLRFYASDSTNSTYVDYQTNAVYRDPSAWYHIVIAFDNTGITASTNIYVNGTQVTSFGTSSNILVQNSAVPFNASGFAAYIGQARTTGNSAFGYFDGYQAEVNFVDGQQLTPSSFGSTNADTGVWQPAKYTGTYGTNGFYLPFTDVATTSGSNAGLGKDFSGNGNYWTTNNISVTTGSTYDSMTDVPTLTSATTANYATLNPLSGRNPNLSNANLTLTASGSLDRNGVSTIAVNSGKWYAEFTNVTNWSGYNQSGIVLASASSPWSVGLNQAFVYIATGQKSDGSSVSSYGASYTSGDVIGVALDCDNGTLTFYKNGTSQGVAFSSNIAGYTWLFTTYVYNNTDQQAANFGQRPFSYTPPTGYNALNTYNLPTSTIVQGNKYMDASLYTGNASTQSITNTAGFKPDLAWIKVRSISGQYVLTDSVRGTNYQLFSSLTNAEQTSSGGITSFNSNGFSLGSGVSPTGSTNENTQTYVAWQWQAGQGTTSSNTNGSITSTVSVNASAGFSIATFTSPSSGTCSFGHGLGVTPAFVVVKSRASGNWICEHTFTGTQYLLLNGTGAATTDSTVFNSAPTSSVVNLGTGFAGSVNYVAYCWAEVAGFSKFGSYTGNGSADGVFVYTGFRPKFVLIKNSGASGYNWIIFDTARDTYNLTTHKLEPNSSAAEGTTYDLLDILSNGFKLRTSDAGSNASGSTYIYACFAENPFKNALAR